MTRCSVTLEGIPASTALGCAPRARRAGGSGFTLVELLVVLLVIAMASGLVGLALRDGASSRLDREAQRLAALLEAGRAEARASGVAVRFELPGPNAGLSTGARSATTPRDRGNDGIGSDGATFRFVGLPPELLRADRWLDADIHASIDGGRSLRLGPEPLIGAQRIVLTLGDRQLALVTDGLAPFAVEIADNAATKATTQ